MKPLHDTVLLFKREFIHALRNPTWLIVGLMTPLLYLALYTRYSRNWQADRDFPPAHVLDVFLPGMLAYLAFMNGVSEGYQTIFNLKDGQIERFRVTGEPRRVADKPDSIGYRLYVHIYCNTHRSGGAIWL